MRVLMCDDDSQIIEQLKKILSKTEKRTGYKFDVVCFSNGDDAISANPNADLAFVDIEMPGVSGLAVAKYLREINPHVIIFVITSFLDYVNDAIDVHALRFIHKPIDNNIFQQHMDTALKLYRQSTEQIAFNNFDEHHRIFTADILYLVIDNRKTKIITKGAEYMSTEKLDYWEKRLERYSYFARPCYSYIVNLQSVTDFNKTELTLTFDNHNLSLPMSRHFYGKFKKSFYDYMGGAL